MTTDNTCPTSTSTCPSAADTNQNQPACATSPASKTISFNHFKDVELRVAQIETVEEVAGSNKLYKLQISLGAAEPKRQLVSGIKKFYTPEQLLNKKIIIVANLEPAKIMGLESQGMLLAADDASSGIVSLLQPDQELPAGAWIR